MSSIFAAKHYTRIASMKIKKMCVMVVVLGAQICAAGCNVISFFPHKAAEVAADKVIDDTLPRDPANSMSPGQKSANAPSPSPSVPQKP